jgi:protein-S-isoprenylcysteine O-methyltransferase Ste14
MSAKANKRKKLGFLIVFVVLTILCWCPIGYGRYGEVALIMGMPSWAFVLLLIGALLFVLQWVYLFKTDLALYDRDVEEIVDALRKIDMEETRI